MRLPSLLMLLFVISLFSRSEAAEPDADIDWAAVRPLFERQRQGQDLSPEQRAMLAAAMAERQRLQEAGDWPPPGMAGGQAGRGPRAAATMPPGPSSGMIPLTELGSDTYRDRDGGLYGGGANQPNAEARALEARLLAEILPRAVDGSPQAAAAGGRIGLLSIGMSNTAQEFAAFMASIPEDAALAPGLVLVNGALGSQDLHSWGSAGNPEPWQHLDQRLADAGLSDAQVQAVWLKHALRLPQTYGDWPMPLRATQAELQLVLSKLTRRFPNLRIVHLSSRSYGGWDERQQPASPEPHAYESAFVVRDLILAQMGGEWSLNPDPEVGPVHAPLLRWGPYLWADGQKPRTDGVSWPRSTFAPDGVHPSPQGRAQVARLLREFYFSNPSAQWFRQ